MISKRALLGLSVAALLSHAVSSSASPPVAIVVGETAPTLAAAVERARDGDVIEVPPGTWKGGVRLDKQVILRGTGGVIDGGGRGTVLTIDAEGTLVEGLRIAHSGSDLGGPDACVYITAQATGTVVRSNILSDCAFGMWVHETLKVSISDNRVIGSLEGHRSNRGNGIHLFNTTHTVLKNNHVTGGRDGIYVSAVEDSLIEGNRFEKTRYGVHYMYSYRNTLRRNVGVGNFAGFALMGSHHIRAVGNVAADNEQHGILLRDMENCVVRDNRLERNGIGLFVYSSTDNVVEGNAIAHNEVGAKIWAGSVRNRVTRNEFLANRNQIFYVSTQDLVWGDQGAGNYFSDYAGWDQNGDGIGDRPYRLDSFLTNLVYRFPAAALLLRSPALELLSHLERRLPLFQVPTVIDKRPLVSRGAI